MPLRVTGRTITLTPPPPVQGVPLKFKKQETNLWCWAACIEMVVKHYKVSKDKQCQIGQKGLALIGPAPSCCTTLNNFNGNNDCKKALDDEQITVLWDQYREIPVVFISGMPTDAARLTELLRTKLTAGILVEIGYADGDEGHVVMLYGWSTKPTDDITRFHIHDPEGNPDMVIFDSHIDANDHGRWNATWLISKPA